MEEMKEDSASRVPNAWTIYPDFTARHKISLLLFSAVSLTYQSPSLVNRSTSFVFQDSSSSTQQGSDITV